MRAVLVLGSAGVGKTWFVNCYCNRGLEDDQPRGLDHLPSKDVEIGGRQWRLMIIERSEQDDEELERWIPVAEAIILMYSIDDEESFNQLENYANLIAQHEARNLVATVVVGSKADMPPESRRVAAEQLLNFSLRHQMPCFEVSSLENHRVSDVFLEIIRKVEKMEALQTLRLRKLPCEIVVVGASFVGKTILIRQYAQEFTRDGEPVHSTIGIDRRKRIVPSAGYQVELQNWDTAGHERYWDIAKHYLQAANAVVIMYDIMDRGKFEDVDFYIKEIQAIAPRNLVVTALVGNKKDMEDRRQVSTSEGQAFARRHNLLFFEVSALNNEGVNDLFVEIITRIVSSKLPRQGPRGTVVLGATLRPGQGNSCQC